MPPASAKLSRNNQRVYESGAVAEDYSTLEDLFPAERTLLARLERGLQGMRMLDLGVGGGRTTLHFAGRVKQYLGLDYSAAMIDRCRRRFPDRPAHMDFAVADARDLSVHGEAAFDFILFSYNGLDYVDHDDRARVLRELRRVAAPGGWICISSHNLMSLGLSPAQAAASRPRWRSILRGLILKMLNGDLRALRAGAYAVIRDDGCRFRLRTYYVRPSEQVKRLLDLGLRDIQVFGLDGRELPAEAADGAEDNWLYYLARVP